MYEEGNLILPSFTAFLQSIHKETNVLKSLAELKNLPANDHSAARLHDIEALVRSIEQNMEEFNELLSGEESTCEVLEQLTLEGAEQHRMQLDDMEAILTARLPVPPIVVGTKQVSSSSAKAMEHKGIKCITPTELELVPKATRGRSLNTGILNTTLLKLKSLIDEKTKQLAVPRKKMNVKQLKLVEDYNASKNADHEMYIYLSEAEIRSQGGIFDSGEATGKAILHTLRHLQRLKMVRASTENTYVLL